MKRCWFGGGLLIFLLVTGLLFTSVLGNFHRELGQTMAQAAALTGENREAAQKLADDARESWERQRLLSAVLYDHTPLEEIGEHFALLNTDAETEDFTEICLRLAARLNALGDSQMLTWENLF